ncbi:DUF2934 domain-containing protein [Chenggangzhangella methanolivorans]|uniref:DUF2934 domain-containing protein n=2 Tax=Chenggangzhangella methanolivorans TaxID=1437009 RepID=A0A9E6ULK7_9HYPH|nr:DUF2934 domain-containing protein [Chenggangzhangella methanolivorans]QZN99070.1 DUF2934 domain-containing protein [Chenggangzhangella methanolivorans]
MTDRNNLIEQRAYDLWVEAGMPDGQAEAHWAQAEREIGAADDSGSVQPALGTINGDD